MSTTLTIKPTDGKCFVTGRDLAIDEKFIAAVRQTPTGLERISVTLECWDKFDRADLLGFWQAVHRPAAAKPRMLIDDNLLVDIFEQLSEATDPAKLGFRFVLGLILLRKRLLVCNTRTRRPDHDIWVVQLKGRTSTIDLVDPHLGESQIADLTAQLGQILAQGI
jgi:hypothetical protein